MAKKKIAEKKAAPKTKRQPDPAKVSAEAEDTTVCANCRGTGKIRADRVDYPCCKCEGEGHVPKE